MTTRRGRRGIWQRGTGICLSLLAAPAALAQAPAVAPPLDRFGGFRPVKLQATGFFRVQKIEERWWLATPDGHPFFSVGVNGIRMNGTATRGGKRHYLDTCKQIYGTREKWAAAQVTRCREWGVNTVGCWSDWQALRRDLPYTVALRVGGQDWLKGNWTDIFSDQFRLFVQQQVRKVALPLKDDPHLLGYWLANEMKWGPDHRGGHLFDQFLKLPATAPAKVALVSFLRQRYGTLARLREKLALKADSWDALLTLDVLPGTTAEAMATRLAWAGTVADRFFAVTGEELRKVDPNHLNLGVRFISQLTPPAVLRAAAKHVDVMSINFYDVGPWRHVLRGFSPDHLSIDGFLAEHYRVCGKPILVSEWGYRAADVGLPNSWPPIYPTLPDQKTRAARYEAYARQVIDKPWLVGHHWFQWVDQPPEGRFDGENNNFGLVNERDQPYEAVTAAMRALRREVYRVLQPPPK